MWRFRRDKLRIGHLVLLALLGLILTTARSSLLALNSSQISPTASTSPTSSIRLNEVAVIASAGDSEWVELANLGDSPVTLEGWSLDDVKDHGAMPFVFGAGVIIEAHSFLRVNTPDMFNDRPSDSVRLLAADGTVIDHFDYSAPGQGSSFGRLPDGTGAWFAALPPTPGASNSPVSTPSATPGTPTLTDVPSSSPTPTGIPSATATGTPSPAEPPPTPTEEPMATPTSTLEPPTTPEPAATPTTIEETPTATEDMPTATETGSADTMTATLTAGPEPTSTVEGSATPAITPSLLRLNELVPVSSEGQSWIELFSLDDKGIDLSGWRLEAASGVKGVLGPGTIVEPGNWYVLELPMGFLLASDTLVLLTPDGQEADRLTYELARADRSFSRIPDGIGPWHADRIPSPGATNLLNALPTPTDTPVQEMTPTSTDTSTPRNSPTQTVRPTVSQTPTRTPRPTRTPANTRTPSSTRTSTSTRTPRVTRTSTSTRTVVPTRTPTSTRTASATRTPTYTRTTVPTRTPSATRTSTVTRTPSPTRTSSATRTPVLTRTPRSTRTATSTRTPTPTRTQTPTRPVVPTRTATITRTTPPTKTPSLTRTAKPSRTSTNTRTPSHTRTPTPTRTSSPSRTPTYTRTVAPTRTATPSRTASPTRTPSVTRTTRPMATTTPTRTASASRTPSATPELTPAKTPTNTRVPTLTRTSTATRTVRPTRTPTSTQTASTTRTMTATRTSPAVITVGPTRTNTSTPALTRTRTPRRTATPTRTPSTTRTPRVTRTRTATRTPGITQAPAHVAQPSGTVSPASQNVPPSSPPSPTMVATPAGTRGNSGSVLISQVFYDPPPGVADPGGEWVVLWNSSGSSVRMTGWELRDSQAEEELPAIDLAAGATLLVAAPKAGSSVLPPTTLRITLSGNIGNGLRNDGDSLTLLDSAGLILDAVSWGDDRSVFDPPVPAAEPGQPLRRQGSTTSTSRSSWIVPAATTEVLPTTATMSPTVTVAATTLNVPAPLIAPAPQMAQSQGRSRVVLSEIAPHDGWIEIFNHGPEPVDLKRWSLAGGSGAATVMLPDVIPIAPNGFVIVQAAALNLTRSGSSITLRDPAGTIVDMAAVAPVEAGRSLSRFPVKGGGWAIDTPLTAGQYNLPGLVQEPSPLPAPAPEQDAEPAMPAVQAPPATPKLWMIPLLAAITGLVFLLVPWRRRSTPAAAPGGEEIKP